MDKRITRAEALRISREILERAERERLEVFLEGFNFDDLARDQCVKSVEDVRTLFGTWPGDADDGFEEAIDELRHGRKGLFGR